MRPPKKHIHNQKHCCWLRKWCFPHWILVDPRLRPYKLWRSHLLYDKATEYYRTFKALQSFFYIPVLLWPHINIDNCTVLPLTSSSLLQTFALKVQCHLSLCTISFPKKSAFVSSKPSRSRPFYFQIEMYSTVWCFLSLAEKFPNTHRAASFPCYNFCSDLVITKTQTWVGCWWLSHCLLLPMASLPVLNCPGPLSDFRLNLLTL